MDTLLFMLGFGCTVYTAVELLQLSRSRPLPDAHTPSQDANFRPGARAQVVSSGRPLTIRADRRRNGRRSADRPL